MSWSRAEHKSHHQAITNVSYSYASQADNKYVPKENPKSVPENNIKSMIVEIWELGGFTKYTTVYVGLLFESTDAANEIKTYLQSFKAQTHVSAHTWYDDNYHWYAHLLGIYFEKAPFIDASKNKSWNPQGDHLLLLSQVTKDCNDHNFDQLWWALNILDEATPFDKLVLNDLRIRLKNTDVKLYREQIEELVPGLKDEKEGPGLAEKAIQIATTAEGKACRHTLWRLAQKFKDLNLLEWAYKAFNAIAKSSAYYKEAQSECGEILNHLLEGSQDLEHDWERYKSVLQHFHNAKNFLRIAHISSNLTGEQGKMHFDPLNATPETILKLVQKERDIKKVHHAEVTDLQSKIIALKTELDQLKVEMKTPKQSSSVSRKKTQPIPQPKFRSVKMSTLNLAEKINLPPTLVPLRKRSHDIEKNKIVRMLKLFRPANPPKQNVGLLKKTIGKRNLF